MKTGSVIFLMAVLFLGETLQATTKVASFVKIDFSRTMRFAKFFLGSCHQVLRDTTTDYLEFSQQEHDYYMYLFQEIDPTTYQALSLCEAVLQESCIKKSGGVEGGIFRGTFERAGFPLLVMDSVDCWWMRFQRKYIEEIARYYNFYMNAQEVSRSRFKKDALYAPFSKVEHDYYLRLVLELDPILYEIIQKYESELSKPCLIEARKGESTLTFDYNEGKPYPKIATESLLNKSIEDQKKALSTLVAAYKRSL